MALVKVVDTRAAADVVAELVAMRKSADLLICVVEARGPANGNDGLWCFVNSRAAASSCVYFADIREKADLRVFYVDSPGESGWAKDHKLRGRL